MCEPFETPVFLKLIRSHDSTFILTDDAIVNITINGYRTALPNSTGPQSIRLGSPALSRKRLRAALKKINGKVGAAYHLRDNWIVQLIRLNTPLNTPDPILFIGCQKFSGSNLNALYTWLNLPRPTGSK